MPDGMETDSRALENLAVRIADLEQLKVPPPEFNVFEAMGVVFQEVRHSDFLAFLLDPRGHHGLGDSRDFVRSYNADDRSKREETEQFRAFGYEELVSRDKANLDIFWLRDKSLEGSEDLQPPDVIAAEIAENLEAALEQFAEIHEDLRLSAAE